MTTFCIMFDIGYEDMMAFKDMGLLVKGLQTEYSFTLYGRGPCKGLRFCFRDTPSSSFVRYGIKSATFTDRGGYGMESRVVDG